MSNTTLTNDTRLYGLPGAENLHLDPADVVQEWLDSNEGEPDFVIEEWSVHPPQYHAPRAEDVVEFIAEHADENEWGEDESWRDLVGDEETLAAARALIDAMASKVTYRMANQRLRTLHVTPSDDPENPYIDGIATWGQRRAPNPESGDSGDA